MVKTTEPRWNDLTADEICSQLRRLSEQVKQMKRAEPLGVIIAAGETAYLAIRKVFPEDTETVKVKPCPYLEKDQCFAIQNRQKVRKSRTIFPLRQKKGKIPKEAGKVR